jgi:hypothetical protein
MPVSQEESSELSTATLKNQSEDSAQENDNSEEELKTFADLVCLLHLLQRVRKPAIPYFETIKRESFHN